MLIELPNGSWIDPKYILMIEAVDREQGEVMLQAPRVILHLSSYDRRVIDCESNEDAHALCQRLAKLMNEQPGVVATS